MPEIEETNPQNINSHVSMIKRNNVWVARESIKLAREILGANGITEDYPIMTWISLAHVDYMFLFWGPMVDIAVIIIIFFKHKYQYY